MSFIQKRLVAAGHLEPFKAVKLFSLIRAMLLKAFVLIRLATVNQLGKLSGCSPAGGDHV
ncbi:MAG: hypothetical protein KME25_20765 [Symplocastrum torsivum CPER-KK1]|uniref:Uncharacterized protein n=1 Tax=Symplocastrum torsivum CPER-KK1 TaxID=450513 RepID=A0A951PP83_9CYAN|nr:hypothetical protein [Symplocastrum torsivum CPER-KK1]